MGSMLMLSLQPSTTRQRHDVRFAACVGSVRTNSIERLRLLALRGLAKVMRLIAIAILLIFAIPPATMTTYGANVGDGLTVEYQIKAAFLYNFAKFVQWPAEASGLSGEPFVLCVSGDEPFRIIHQYLAGKKVRGQLITVRAVDNVGGASGCHLLFVSAMSAQLRQALPHVIGSILTIGESEDFIRSGGMINLVRADNRLRFEIARNAGERAGLKFSSQLLKLATPVSDSPGSP